MAMSDKTEALARVLWGNGNTGTDVAGSYADQARRILANPGPLLAALAEAGVLTSEESPRIMGRNGRMTVVPPARRYVTEWEDLP